MEEEVEETKTKSSQSPASVSMMGISSKEVEPEQVEAAANASTSDAAANENENENWVGMGTRAITTAPTKVIRGIQQHQIIALWTSLLFALASIVISSLALRQSFANASQLGAVLAPDDLLGVWQVCGSVSAVYLTGTAGADFQDLYLAPLDATLTYVFRSSPTGALATPSSLLFVGDRCGFDRRPLPGVDPPAISGNSPTVGTLSPDGRSATFLQYFDSAGVVGATQNKTLPRKVYAQHHWTFIQRDTARVEITSWYDTNEAHSDNTAIWGYQGSALYRKVGPQSTCEEVAQAGAKGKIDLDLGLNQCRANEGPWAVMGRPE